MILYFYFNFALPALLWVIFRITLPPGPFEMDHSGQPGTFYALMIAYQRFFYFVAGASIAGAVAARMFERNEPAATLLLAAACAMLFNGLLTLWYESYLHTRGSQSGQGKSSYTANKYALILSLGVSAAVLLLVGVAQLVWAA